MKDYQTYQATDGEIWYYNPKDGLYYSNFMFLGIGYQLKEIERFDDGRY